MWLSGGRTMGSTALVGAAVLIAIEYAANGGQLTARAPPPDPTFAATLSRGPCLGTCPVYRVTIDAAGEVVFIGGVAGRGPVIPPCPGEHRWRVPLSAVSALATEVDRSGIFGFKPDYRADITDLPQYAVTITRRGHSKTVTDYAGRLAGAPPALQDLEHEIDLAADSRRCLPPRPR